MTTWELWKKGFDAWESATASFLEKALSSPAVLAPAGALLTATMKTKAAWDRALAEQWGHLGLASKRDLERALHTLNRLESMILDLEERQEVRREEASSRKPRSK